MPCLVPRVLALLLGRLQLEDFVLSGLADLAKEWEGSKYDEC